MGLLAKIREEERLLTPSEKLVYRLMLTGVSHAEAAERLFVATKTVKWHANKIAAKLGVKSKVELLGRLLSIGIAELGAREFKRKHAVRRVLESPEFLPKGAGAIDDNGK